MSLHKFYLIVIDIDLYLKDENSYTFYVKTSQNHKCIVLKKVIYYIIKKNSNILANKNFRIFFSTKFKLI